MQQRLNGLKSRSDESRMQAAKDLQHYVSTELREASAEQYTSFMDELNHHIFEMVSSSDANEKKGGIMAIGEYYNVSLQKKGCHVESKFYHVTMITFSPVQSCMSGFGIRSFRLRKLKNPHAVIRH